MMIAEDARVIVVAESAQESSRTFNIGEEKVTSRLGNVARWLETLSVPSSLDFFGEAQGE